jgi:hypothetical protein
LLTCYSPVRRSSTPKGLSARLACVKHAASVRPEPGSNSPTKTLKSDPDNQRKLPKTPQPPPNAEARAKLGTGLSNTLLSSQETNAHRNGPSKEDQVSGATPLLYPSGSDVSTPRSRICQPGLLGPPSSQAPREWLRVIRGSAANPADPVRTRPARCRRINDTGPERATQPRPRMKLGARTNEPRVRRSQGLPQPAAIRRAQLERGKPRTLRPPVAPAVVAEWQTWPIRRPTRSWGCCTRRGRRSSAERC